MKRRVSVLLLAAFLAFIIAPAVALARRSGGSFGSRSGFRSGGGSYSRGYSANRTRGGGSNFVFLPGFGWGWGGLGGGGFGFGGTIILLTMVGLGAAMAIRAWRQSHGRGLTTRWHDDEDEAAAHDRAYVYKIQLGLGRSARGIQERLAKFATEGDTSSEGGLAHLLHQTALELIREQHSIRYGAVEATGPLNMVNGETKLNAAALSERSRFSVERVRGADGRVRHSQEAPSEGEAPLEYVVVTVALATREPLAHAKMVHDPSALDSLLGELGAVPASALLGLEVVWTPADPQDSLTESDLLTTYPEMRSL